METLNIQTNNRVDFINITKQVNDIINEAEISNGIATIYVPHTTCGIMINEGADPDVVSDIQYQLKNMVPYQKGYLHIEGNSDSHIKTCLVGSSETVIINMGKLLLGTWQSIFLCDFDGPRNRKVYIQITN